MKMNRFIREVRPFVSDAVLNAFWTAKKACVDSFVTFLQGFSVQIIPQVNILFVNTPSVNSQFANSGVFGFG